jgi:hypothetical protein
LRAVFDALQTTPNIARCGFVGFALLVSELAPVILKGWIDRV